MKRIISLLMAVLMLCALCVPAFAEEETYAAQGLCGSDGEVHWTLSEDCETLTISGHGNMINFDDWDETPWYPYDAYEKVKHIVVGDGITRIGSYAFAYFYYLESIELGEGVEFIEDYAFYQAPYYTSIDLVIPSTVFYIGQYAFSDARGLRNVYIKSDYDALPYYVKGETYHPVMGDDYKNDYFLDHNGNFKADGIYIEYRAFYKCYNLATLTVGNTEKFNEKNVRIGYAAFEKCEGLHTIRFADSLASIAEAAFYKCSALRNIYYYGTPDQFGKVSIDRNWNDDLFKVINGSDGRRMNYCLDFGKHTYIDENGNTAMLDGSKVRCKILDSNTTELTGGWYIVDSKIDCGTTRLHVTADSNILLLDHCGIETSGGIDVNNTVLGIYAQSSDEDTMGYINVADSEPCCAGIGGGNGVKDGTVMIFGGKIEACGGINGAGIGSGQDGACEVIITRGIVTGSGGSFGAGIGSGQDGVCEVIITGGIVTGSGGSGGAGIGSGVLFDKTKERCCTVKISGGAVTATGGGSGAGIGSGSNGNAKVYISDGTVTASGGSGGAGIGGGFSSSATVIISDGTVTATGGDNGAGIGSGIGSSTHITDLYVELSGGTIKAQGGNGGADIGSGFSNNCRVVISGGDITGGIGSGTYGSCTVEDNRSKIGSALSEGSLWIVAAVGAAAVVAVAAIVIVKKKPEERVES